MTMSPTTARTSALPRMALVSRAFVLIFAAVLACCVVRIGQVQNWSSTNDATKLFSRVLRTGNIAETELTLVQHTSPNASDSPNTDFDLVPVGEKPPPGALRKVPKAFDGATHEEENVNSSFSVSTDSEEEPDPELSDNAIVFDDLELLEPLQEGEVADDNNAVTFDDLELLEMIGSGSVSMDFIARLKGRSERFVAKITYLERDLLDIDSEIDTFGILNAEPTIGNIPKLALAINRIPNPYQKKLAHLMRELKVDSYRAMQLSSAKEISVMVMEYANRGRMPETVDELRVFLQSLLSTFEFAHSRNVMMCDLQEEKVHFDGEMVRLVDWNSALFFMPNSVMMDYPKAPHHLMPPEAKKGNVHRTVSGMDIWTTGLLLGRLMETYNYSLAVAAEKDDSIFSQITNLRDLMMKEDPHERPDATKLLRHKFFTTPEVLSVEKS